jgi:hypothetical protein
LTVVPHRGYAAVVPERGHAAVVLNRGRNGVFRRALRGAARPVAFIRRAGLRFRGARRDTCPREAHMRTRSRQGGWVGIIVLLLALVIVALLGKTLLQQMGLSTSPAKERAVARPGNVQSDVATPPPMQALERARSLQDTVQQQARENAARIDKAAQ